MKKLVKFSKEFKLKAVHLSEKSDNIQDLATSLGLSGGLLYRWRKEYFDRVGKSTGILDPEREELKRLRRENKDLKEERDILKRR